MDEDNGLPQTKIRSDLYAEICEYQQAWQRQIWFYATLSILFRVTLIATTAIVAVQKAAAALWPATSPSWLDKFFLILSVTVAILTALDSWLKPRDKWRGFMGVSDDARDLALKTREASETDTATLGDLRNKFNALRQYHREHNVF
jgi:hypothetical protein